MRDTKSKDTKSGLSPMKYAVILHMAAPKMKSSRMLGMSVNGIQKTAIIRSLMAKDKRNELVTVRIRLFSASTTMMRRFPKTLSRKMSVYSRIRNVSISANKTKFLAQTTVCVESTASSSVK